MSVIFFVFIFFFNLFIFKNLSLITSKLNFYDIPDNYRKIHVDKISKIGGLILYFNLTIFFIYEFLFNFSLQGTYLFFTLTISFLISLYNDKKDIKPSYRLIIFYLIFLIWTLADDQMVIKNLNFDFISLNIELGFYGFFITPLFMVIFLNALNLFDGVNLQSITYYLLFFVFFYLNEIEINSYLSLTAFLIFFSYYNFKNKIFLGDSGVTIFAILIIYITITNYNSDNETLNCEKIFTIMFLPGIDMLRVYFLRILTKKKPFEADKNHLHHYLLNFISHKYVFFYQLILNSLIIWAVFIMNYNYSNVIIFLVLFYILTISISHVSKKLSKNS